MSEPTTIDPTAAVGPAGPVPQANPAVPTPAIPIPDGPPGEAALALLQAVRPDAPSVLSARIEAIEAGLDGLVEAARLDVAMPLTRYIAAVGPKVRLGATLRSRAGGRVASEQKPGVSRPVCWTA
jgi:hypothetical protein